MTPMTLKQRHAAEYMAWCGARYRCTQEKGASWHNYGGRGIRMCERWMNSFENFLDDVGPKPTPRHSLDRINNDGNYEPGNVRWATRSEQALNTRNRTSERRHADNCIKLLLRQGFTRNVIVRSLGVKPHVVDKVVLRLRRAAAR